MELILWILLIVPGIIYSIWRVTTRYNSCPLCKSADIVPAESPMGRKFIAEMDSNVKDRRPQNVPTQTETPKGALGKLKASLQTQTEVGHVDYPSEPRTN